VIEYRGKEARGREMFVYQCPSCFELLVEPWWCPRCGTSVEFQHGKELDVETDNVIDPHTELYLDGSSPMDEDRL